MSVILPLAGQRLGHYSQIAIVRQSVADVRITPESGRIGANRRLAASV
jgi:hypothetical protein